MLSGVGIVLYDAQQDREIKQFRSLINDLIGNPASFFIGFRLELVRFGGS